MQRHLVTAHPRNGVTLTEVLVAIFIMGIGLLSLLVLFPLGALQMAQAIRDDRCTHASLSARALANLRIPYGNDLRFTLKDDPFTVFPYYTISAYNGLPSLTAAQPFPTGYDGPSYPVYIDPIGVRITLPFITASNQNPGTFAGGIYTGPNGYVSSSLPNFPIFNNPSGTPLGKFGNSPGIPRVCPSFINVQSQTTSANGMTPYTTTAYNDLERWCTMTDDIQFVQNGTQFGIPDTQSGNIQRENRYTWAWLCQQAGLSGASPPAAPSPQGIYLTLVVYDRRPQIANAATGAPAGETPCQATFTRGSNQATLTWTGAAPNLKPGTWILDASLHLTSSGFPPGVVTNSSENNGRPHAFFYRIVNSSITSANSAQVELHMPAWANAGLNVANGGPPGVAVVMENVAEVYAKGLTTPQ